MSESVIGASILTEPDASASSEFAAQQQTLRGYIPALDGIRALAIIAVIWHNATAGHYSGGVVSSLINMLANAGWVGVQLFFVLSGFLITGILLDENKSSFQLRNFYMRRFLRIFPLYYFVLCVAFLLLPLLNAVPVWLVDDVQQQIWHWLFLTNWASPVLGVGIGFGHFWSIAVEEQFYLLWPLCVIALQRGSLMRLCLCLIASALLIRMILIAYDLEFAKEAAYKFTIARWDALAIGALLALLVRDRIWFERMVLLAPKLFWGACAYVLIFMAFNRNFTPVDSGLAVFNQTAISLLFGVLVFYAVRVNAGHMACWQRFLSLSAMRSIGKYSYAMYIFHMPLMRLFSPLWKNYFPQLPSLVGATVYSLLVFGATYVLALLSWVLLEQPCLRLKRFFVTDKNTVSNRSVV